MLPLSAATIIFYCLFQNVIGTDNMASLEFWDRIGRENMLRKLNARGSLANEKPPKNIILFIGDGMGITAVTAARIYKSQKEKNPYIHAPHFFETFESAGLAKTHSYNIHVTDSAASAVALNTGQKVEQEIVGTQPNIGKNCTLLKSEQIHSGTAEMAIKSGKEVGIVTTTRITHATPAAFYAKGVHRNIESDNGSLPECRDIALQMLDFPANQFKVLLGGGRKEFETKAKGGDRTDNRNLIEEWLKMGNGLGMNRTYISSHEELTSNSYVGTDQLLGLLSNNHLPFYSDAVGNGSVTSRLYEMTQTAISVLERDSPDGYFLMVEGGLIDIAEHSNWMHIAAEELLEFDKAIKTAREMTDPSETLIVVTADHSHAVSLPGYMRKTMDIFGETINSYQVDLKVKVPGILFATGPGYDEFGKTHTAEQIADMHYMTPAAFNYTLGNHGGDDVGIWADGPFSWLFSGTIENTEIAYLNKFLLCVEGHDDTICEQLKKRENQMVNARDRQPGFFTHFTNGQLWTTFICLIIATLVSICSTLLMAMYLYTVHRKSLYSLDSDSTLVK